MIRAKTPAKRPVAPDQITPLRPPVAPPNPVPPSKPPVAPDQITPLRPPVAPPNPVPPNRSNPTMKKGGKVASASRRADGIAQRGKTKGRMI